MVAMEVRETSTLVSFVAADAGVALVPASAQLMNIGGAVYRSSSAPHTTYRSLSPGGAMTNADC